MKRVTRGHGLLEGFLAERRAAMADRLIPAERRNGRLLDIGCGSYPLFLTRVHVASKFGVDKGIGEEDIRAFQSKGITLVRHDIEVDPILPFSPDSFDIVTMLAVVEHIAPRNLVGILSEARRVLKPGGLCIITTPARLTGPILKALALLRLVSAEEIREHKAAYRHGDMHALLEQAGFDGTGVRLGRFECLMNTWAVAER